MRIERTKETLDDYFCCRSSAKEFFGVRDPLGEDVQTAMRKTFVYIIIRLKTQHFTYGSHVFCRWFGFSTNLTGDGHQVIVVRNITDEDVPGRYLDQWTKYFLMCVDWNLKRVTANGVIVIYDMATTNRNEILTQMTPSFLKKSLECSVSHH